MPVLKSKSFLFPTWVWLLGLLGWFSAEIVTASTLLTKIDPGTLIFSFSYYLVQLAIVADLILRKRLSLWGIFLLGLFFGILEETFYIKNPLLLTALLVLGHSIVTVTFPYLLANFLIPGKKEPFLSKNGYILAFGYLAVLYFFMARFFPFIYLDSLILGLVLIPIIIVLLRVFGSSDLTLGSGGGMKIGEKLGVVVLAALLTIISQQNYVGVIVIFLWFLLRQKSTSLFDIYFMTGLFIVFHFLGSFFNKTDLSKIMVNYPLSLMVGLLVLFWFLRKRKILINF